LAVGTAVGLGTETVGTETGCVVGSVTVGMETGLVKADPPS
jgi:hypothetical protein